MKDSDKVTILEQIQSRQLLSPQQLTELAEESRASGTDMLDLIVTQQLIDEEQFTEVKAEVLRVPYVHLVDQDIPNDVLNLVSQDIAENYQLVPWSKQEGEVSVAMADPHDYKAIEALDFIGRKENIKWKYYLASDSSISSVLRQYADLTDEVAEALQASEEGMHEDIEEEVEDSVKSAPISKMVAVILRYAVVGSASDVHIEPTKDGTRVRYRVDGVLHTSLQMPKNVHNSLVARIKVLANLKLDETRLPQDGRFHSQIEGREVDFRVSTLPVLGQEKVVLRILDKAIGIRTLAELGFHDRNLHMIENHLERPHGMILVTGPTGSGKSTTLYSILQDLNQEERNIITLEDPVEYNMPGISQSQIHPEIGLTFARGLRSILRQDPDIIMVGEVRDNETAELAIHAALTGHMLLSTLHTTDALGAIPRLIDMKAESFLIASALNLVIAQRLVRKNCVDCVTETQLPVKTESEVLRELQSIPEKSLPKDITMKLPLTVYHGVGCPKCEGSGYHGRVAISEVIEITPRLQDIIASEEINQFELVHRELEEQGMVNMRQDGIILALRGQTTIEEVWTATTE